MVGKFTTIALIVVFLCSFTIAKDGKETHKAKAHKHHHDDDTIDIDNPDGYVMDGAYTEEGSGPDDDTEDDDDDDDWGSGTNPIIPGSGGGPEIVPVPVTGRPSSRPPTRRPTTQTPLTPCQQLLNSSTSFKDSYIPHCTKTGEFNRTQCRGYQECWCVNPGGKKIAGTVTKGPGKPDCEGGAGLTPCVYMKVRTEWEQLLGAFIPRCTENGAFEKIQCRENACWCVDSFGQVLAETLVSLPNQPHCHPTTTPRQPEGPIVTKVDRPVYVTPGATNPDNKIGEISPEDDDGYETKEEETNEVGKEEESRGDPDTKAAPSIMGQPGILAGIIGGAVVGLLCAILLVMFIVYRMKKKDEGSYALDEPTKARGAYAYQKAPDREFYA